jgi:hypothetical protein
MYIIIYDNNKFMIRIVQETIVSIDTILLILLLQLVPNLG